MGCSFDGLAILIMVPYEIEILIKISSLLLQNNTIDGRPKANFSDKCREEYNLFSNSF